MPKINPLINSFGRFAINHIVIGLYSRIKVSNTFRVLRQFSHLFAYVFRMLLLIQLLLIPYFDNLCTPPHTHHVAINFTNILSIRLNPPNVYAKVGPTLYLIHIFKRVDSSPETYKPFFDSDKSKNQLCTKILWATVRSSVSSPDKSSSLFITFASDQIF